MKTKSILTVILTSCLGLVSFTSCLNLDEELYGRLSPENYYKTKEEALSSVVGVYSNIFPICPELVVTDGVFGRIRY